MPKCSLASTSRSCVPDMGPRALLRRHSIDVMHRAHGQLSRATKHEAAHTPRAVVRLCGGRQTTAPAAQLTLARRRLYAHAKPRRAAKRAARSRKVGTPAQFPAGLTLSTPARAGNIYVRTVAGRRGAWRPPSSAVAGRRGRCVGSQPTRIWPPPRRASTRVIRTRIGPPTTTAARVSGSVDTRGRSTPVIAVRGAAG